MSAFVSELETVYSVLIKVYELKGFFCFFLFCFGLWFGFVGNLWGVTIDLVFAVCVFVGPNVCFSSCPN